MPSYPNPVLRSVTVRTIGPFVPVWLFGVVFGLALDRWGASGGLSHVQVIEFLAFYTLLTGALVAGLFLRQYQSSPVALEIEVEGVTGEVYRRGGTAGAATRRLAFLYEAGLRVRPGGLFGWRVEGRPEGTRSLDWLNLTAENASRVAEAIAAWKARESPSDPGPLAPPASAAAP